MWPFNLDPTVQVALIGVVIAVITGSYGVVLAILKPKDDEHQKEYGPKPTLITMSDKDRAIFEMMIKSIDDLGDAIERHRQDLSRRN